MTQASSGKQRKSRRVSRRSFMKTAATGTALASGMIGAPYVNAQAKAKLVIQTRPARFTKLEQMKASFIAKSRKPTSSSSPWPASITKTPSVRPLPRSRQESRSICNAWQPKEFSYTRARGTFRRSTSGSEGTPI